MLTAHLSLAFAVPQRSLGSFGGFGDIGSFGGFRGGSSSGWSRWSRTSLGGGSAGSRTRQARIDDGVGLRKSAFTTFESSWLKGGRDTDDGYWYTGAQRRKVAKKDDDATVTDDEVDAEEVESLSELLDEKEYKMERTQSEQVWYRGGIEALRVGGQRETSKYKAIGLAEPGKWYEVSTDNQGIAAEPFIRISNALSRGWDELLESGAAARTAEGARYLGREEAEGRAVRKGPKKGGRRDQGTRKASDLKK